MILQELASGCIVVGGSNVSAQKLSQRSRRSRLGSSLKPDTSRSRKAVEVEAAAGKTRAAASEQVVGALPETLIKVGSDLYIYLSLWNLLNLLCCWGLWLLWNLSGLWNCYLLLNRLSTRPGPQTSRVELGEECFVVDRV